MESGAHGGRSLRSVLAECGVPGLRCGGAPCSWICQQARPAGCRVRARSPLEKVRDAPAAAGMCRDCGGWVAQRRLGPAQSFGPCPGMSFLPWPPHFPVCTLLGPECFGPMRRWPDPRSAHWCLAALCVIPDPRDSSLGVGRDREVDQDTHLPVPHAGGEPEACLDAGEGF